MDDFHVGFVLFPGVTQLDFTGPYEVLSRLGTPPSTSVPSRFADTKVHVLASSLHPITSDRGLTFLPTCTFDQSPALDVLCVPGGSGVADALDSVATVEFIRRQGQRAKYVTSVCTGAFLLGASGLLMGRRATTHWAYTHLLPLFGARHENQRVVRDDNLFTAGGVTSGIDFGFTLVGEIAGSDVAQAIQLGLEYDPSPPYDAGGPDKAPEAAKSLMLQRNEKVFAAIRKWASRTEPPEASY